MDPQQGPAASETFPALGLWKFGLDFRSFGLVPMNNPEYAIAAKAADVVEFFLLHKKLVTHS